MNTFATALSLLVLVGLSAASPLFEDQFAATADEPLTEEGEGRIFFRYA